MALGESEENIGTGRFLPRVLKDYVLARITRTRRPSPFSMEDSIRHAEVDTTLGSLVLTSTRRA
jgi:hypothetical protein